MMKPVDIPKDIWDAAVAADEAANAAYGDSINDPFVSEEQMDIASITVIAKAILAERKRCLEVVRDYRAWRLDPAEITTACTAMLVALEAGDDDQAR